MKKVYRKLKPVEASAANQNEIARPDTTSVAPLSASKALDAESFDWMLDCDLKAFDDDNEQDTMHDVDIDIDTDFGTDFDAPTSNVNEQPPKFSYAPPTSNVNEQPPKFSYAQISQATFDKGIFKENYYMGTPHQFHNESQRASLTKPPFSLPSSFFLMPHFIVYQLNAGGLRVDCILSSNIR